MVLVGISSNTTNPQGFKVKGAMQLYSRERAVSQPIEGHAASFAQVRLDGASEDTKLFAFAVRTATGAKVSHRFAVILRIAYSFIFLTASHRRD